jgi:hypothetical protein
MDLGPMELTKSSGLFVHPHLKCVVDLCLEYDLTNIASYPYLTKLQVQFKFKNQLISQKQIAKRYTYLGPKGSSPNTGRWPS